MYGVDTPEVWTTDLQEKSLGRDASEFAKQWFSQDGEIIVKTSKDVK